MCFLKNISQVVLISNKWTGFIYLDWIICSPTGQLVSSYIGSIIACIVHVTLIIVKREINDGVSRI